MLYNEIYVIVNIITKGFPNISVLNFDFTFDVIGSIIEINKTNK